MGVILSAAKNLPLLTNFYIQVPSAHPGAYPSNYFVEVVQGVIWALSHGPQWLLFHVIVGLLLFLWSLILIVLAIAARRRAWIITTILGLIGIMGAGFNSASFMNFGGQGFSSMLMSVGFLLAVISYAVGFYITR